MNESGSDRTDDGIENKPILVHPKRICKIRSRGWIGMSVVNKLDKVVANKKESKL